MKEQDNPRSWRFIAEKQPNNSILQAETSKNFAVCLLL